jgi:molybdenum cofactor biosynthesis enzyme MoaA
MIGAKKMLEDIFKKHIAVSSLESPDHASRKDPKIVSVSWFLGKRCNYDCSYCPTFVHDNYSPHMKKEKIYDMIDQIEKQISLQNKEFKISITGGEPFVHPAFIDICKKLKEKKSCKKLSVVTNGSVSYEMYVKSIQYIDNLTISLHLEKPEKTTNLTLEKILKLNKNKKLFLNVNLMAVPGKFDKIKQIISLFTKNEIKFVLRKIDPPYKEGTIKLSKTKGLTTIKNADEFNKHKSEMKIKNRNNKEERFIDYYSAEELAFLNSYSNKKQWNNIRLYTENAFFEFNTDDLIKKTTHNWKGWNCYIGIDSLYIQHNGTIFRGNCLQGNSIGKIGEKIKWPTHPIRCPISSCSCNLDMVIRKVKDIKYNKLIND